MAVAARPGASDARVPCPLCGGLIHPIAGKCKHCKADLTTYHASRPAANAPLPALFRAAAVHDSPRHGHAAPAYAVPAHPVPVATAREPSQAVLPPRPTGHVHAAPPASGWRSWPVLVIILATIAIVIAAILMVWPARADRDGQRARQPGPAPERMDTQNPGQGVTPKTPRAAPVTPPQGRTPDPWRQTQPTPAPSDPGADTGTDDQDHDIDSLADPLTSPHGRPAPRGRRKLAVGGRGMVMFAMADHLCRKMVQCGNDDATTAQICNSISTGPADLPTNCPAAARCLQHIDAMACSAQGDDLQQLRSRLAQFRDCEEATRC
jgi:hypothetical protein